MAREKYLIIGDGIAGATAAETLRSHDAESEITMLTTEGEPLYNRVQIKDYAKGNKPEEKCKIHDMKWYEDRNIQLHLYAPVARVDDAHNLVVCEDGRKFPYTKLLLAVGGNPRKYPVPNGQAEGVHTFWTFADARRIRAHAQEAKHAVAIGAGLLGIDLAVIFAKNGVPTKYIMRGNRWWREGLNKDGSAIVEGYLKELGVDCIFGETPTHFNADDKGHVREVVTDKGITYPADIVGAAIGLNMNLRCVTSSNVKTGEGILANEYLQTSVPNIYTAGDCAQYYDITLNRVQINGSWASAKRQGEVAAMNMLKGNHLAFEFVDFYSIDHFDKPVMSVGNIMGDEILEGLVAEGVYRRLIFKENRLIGAVMVGDAKPLPFMKKVISARTDVSAVKAEMMKGTFDWKGYAAGLKAPAA
ncbi:MAG TPA: FAD-dependent oxidoreductase [Candidatus Thermoplasmatota archaeon]|nr:FAD-dependent oxidoreductase [Candidatus Thermoplasmatota archaeon]